MEFSKRRGKEGKKKRHFLFIIAIINLVNLIIAKPWACKYNGLEMMKIRGDGSLKNIKALSRCS